MKTLLLFVATLPLFAQPASIPFGQILQQGSASLYCSQVDIRSLGGLFALMKPSIVCWMTTTNPATTDFYVTITTQDSTGKIHAQADHTGVNLQLLSGESSVIHSSPLGFQTDDAILLSVTVEERSLLSRMTFTGN